MPTVNPDILTWARETSGMSLEEAAKAIGIKPASLKGLEEGEHEPSNVQLANMAERYRRPLTVFYLRSPPPLSNRGEDFRRAPDSPPIDYDPRLDALIRDVQARHDLAKSLLEDEEIELHDFIGSKSARDSAVEIAQSIQSTIGFDLAKFRSGNEESGFTYLRNCFERHGVFVVLLGNLGSYHSNISAMSFRGYAIADPIAPFIVVNDNDAPVAWSFTVLHEAAHLWLGKTGVSGSTEGARIERLCNEVAGLILLPRVDLQFLRDSRANNFEKTLEFISEFASSRKVSRRMVAYQLLLLNKMDRQLYQRVSDRFFEDWQRSKEREKSNRSGTGGGPNRYVVLRHRLGHALVGLARRSFDRGALTPTKASRLLGVNAGAVRNFLHPVPKTGAN